MASLLPGDAVEDSPADNIFEKIQPSSEMQNSILAIVQADPKDKHEMVRDASVIGFVYVKDVDEKKRKLLIGAPLSGRLPSRVLIWGAFPEPFAGIFG
jgi:polyribonucleotide 5'-hydroxyl-kinase